MPNPDIEKVNHPDENTELFRKVRGNVANITPMSERDPEEVKAISSKGGKASGPARKMSNTFKQAMEWALDLPAIRGNAMVEVIRKRYPDITNREAMAIAMTAQAIIKQDVRAFVAVRDTVGELPAQTVNVKNEEPITINIKTVD